MDLYNQLEYERQAHKETKHALVCVSMVLGGVIALIAVAVYFV